MGLWTRVQQGRHAESALEEREGEDVSPVQGGGGGGCHKFNLVNFSNPLARLNPKQRAVM
jgi:hypothetical protein